MSDDDIKNDASTLFRREMGGVTPLKPNKRISLFKPARKFFRQTEKEQDSTINDVFSDAPVDEDCPDILNFSAGGLQHITLRQLRQGKITIEHRLDLHGLNVQQARHALIDFLHDCEQRELRHVIIVHGKGYRSKGKPVIKPMINRWLRLTPTVLAFHSALPKDGGSGAVYVLLRKSHAIDEADIDR